MLDGIGIGLTGGRLPLMKPESEMTFCENSQGPKDPESIKRPNVLSYE